MATLVYIDVVTQPALTFYVSREGEGTKTDFQRPYLEHMARYLGSSDIRVLRIQPTEDASPKSIEESFKMKLDKARTAGENF